MCDHNHHHQGCEHDSGDGEDHQGVEYSLYQKIDLENIECLNERIDGTGKKVFKPWVERFNKDDYVESDCDAELLYNIPFAGDVKIKGIAILGAEGLSSMKLFKNKLRMSFDDIGVEPDQEFGFTADSTTIVELPVKPAKFSNVHSLSLHLRNKQLDSDENPCRIYYIGLKGEFTPVDRNAVVIATYEARPIPEPNSGIESIKINHQVQ